MKKSCCCWCHKTIDVPDQHDPWLTRDLCSQVCKDAEKLWRLYMSDFNMTLRLNHKKAKRMGGSNGSTNSLMP